MAIEPLRLGPWMGIDNVHSPDARAFQRPGRTENRLAALVSALDVDLDDDGWPSSRQALAEDAVLTDGSGGWEVLGRMFVQDGAVLYEYVSEALVPRVTGLVERVALCSYAGLVYGSDGATHFELDGAMIRPWGLPVPDFTASAAGGTTIAAGTYRVQLSFSDARGNEGAVADSIAVTLSTAGAILITLGAGAATGASHVNVYIGRDRQPETSFVAQILIESMPYTATSVKATAGDPSITKYMQGPPTGIVGVTGWRAYLLAWRDNIVFRSEPQEPHLFDPHNNMPFDAVVQGVEGVAGGLWVATTKGMIWLAGENPEQLIPIQKSTAAVFKGSTRLSGRKLGFLQSNELVALFVSTDGLLIGTSDGTLLRPTDEHYHFDHVSRASIAYSERGDLHQLLIGLVEN